jgi:hypothetical protein
LGNLISVLTGERVVDQIDVSTQSPASKTGSSTRGVRRSLRRRLRDALASQDSPGASSSINFRELAISILAWGVIGAVVLALGYICYMVAAFVYMK